MKKTNFFGILLFFLFGLSLQLSAQTNVTFARLANDTLKVTGTYNSIQWQISSDNNAWYSIPGATSPTYIYKVVAPAYLRAMLVSPSNVTSYSDVQHALLEAKTYLKKVISSGGQGYAETNGVPGSGISIQEDRRSDNSGLNLKAISTGWTNTSTSLVWYLYTSAGSYDMDMTYYIPNGVTQQFELTISDINSSGMVGAPIKSVISVKGKGVNDSLTISSFTAPVTGFYRYELKPLATPNSQTKIIRTWFKSYSNAAADVHATNYLNPPSCHLTNWRTTESGVNASPKSDWVYESVLVPTGGDAPSTYYMTLGVSAGYMGIQANSSTVHGVIFSMWDNGSTEQDPFLSAEMKAGALDADPSATVKRFGGEGTGTQVLLQNGWYWEVNKPVQFLSNARLETFNDTLKSKLTGADSIVTRKNTLVSAWFNNGSGWRYIATLRRAFDQSYFNSWYSFIEGFGYQVGQFKRDAYYYNGFMHLAPTETRKAGQWVHCNQVNYGHTDGAVGQRRDYEQKAQPAGSPVPNAFYMSTGGYANSPVITATTIPLATDKTVVDTLNLAAFAARVDQAIAKDKHLKDSIRNVTTNLATKNGWTIEGYSSQETSGEGAINGRAACVIDGNAATYWHSSWQSSGTANFPHWISVDMHATNKVTGFLFKLSGGTTRHMKGIELWGAADGASNYTLIQSQNVPDLEEMYIPLTAGTKAIHKFKLVINSSQSGQVFCRINEIDVTVDKSGSTAINQIFLKKNSAAPISIFPNPVKDMLNFSLGQKNASNATADIFNMNSSKVLTAKLGNLLSYQVLHLNTENLPRGIYMLQVKEGSRVIGNQSFIKK